MTDHYGAQVRAQLAQAREQLAAAETERDGAYRERAHLLAWLAALYPAVLAPAPDVAEPGWQILYLTAGGQQLSWHIAPADADLLKRVPRVGADDPRARWDGHTTAEKYGRIRRHTTAVNLLSGGRPVDPATRAGTAEVRIAAIRALVAEFRAEEAYGGEADGLNWAARRIEEALDGAPEPEPTAARCCVCGTTKHGGRTYENYRGQLFCIPCADPEPPAAVPAQRRCRVGFCRACRTIHAVSDPS